MQYFGKKVVLGLQLSAIGLFIIAIVNGIGFEADVGSWKILSEFHRCYIPMDVINLLDFDPM